MVIRTNLQTYKLAYSKILKESSILYFFVECFIKSIFSILVN